MKSLEKSSHRVVDTRNQSVDVTVSMLKVSSDRFCGAVAKTHLQEELLTFMASMLRIILRKFPQLNCDSLLSVVGEVIEEVTFTTVESTLNEFYRHSYLPMYRRFKRCCRRLQSWVTDPSVLGAKQTIPVKSFEGKEHNPYKAAMEALKRMSSVPSPSQKLRVLQEVGQLVIQCSGSQTSADEFIPVLTYIIIHANCSLGFTDCHLIFDFIGESMLRGEEGYLLVTYSSCLDYVLRLRAGTEELTLPLDEAGFSGPLEGDEREPRCLLLPSTSPYFSSTRTIATQYQELDIERNPSTSRSPDGIKHHSRTPSSSRNETFAYPKNDTPG